MFGTWGHMVSNKSVFGGDAIGHTRAGSGVVVAAAGARPRPAGHICRIISLAPITAREERAGKCFLMAAGDWGNGRTPSRAFRHFTVPFTRRRHRDGITPPARRGRRHCQRASSVSFCVLVMALWLYACARPQFNSPHPYCTFGSKVRAVKWRACPETFFRVSIQRKQRGISSSRTVDSLLQPALRPVSSCFVEVSASVLPCERGRARASVVGYVYA